MCEARGAEGIADRFIERPAFAKDEGAREAACTRLEALDEGVTDGAADRIERALSARSFAEELGRVHEPPARRRQRPALKLKWDARVDIASGRLQLCDSEEMRPWDELDIEEPRLPMVDAPPAELFAINDVDLYARPALAMADAQHLRLNPVEAVWRLDGLLGWRFTQSSERGREHDRHEPKPRPKRSAKADEKEADAHRDRRAEGPEMERREERECVGGGYDEKHQNATTQELRRKITCLSSRARASWLAD